MSPCPARPWHFAQTPTKVSLPRAAVEPCRSATQASYSLWGSTSTCAIIAACWMPQNSAHWPSKVPSFDGVKVIVFFLPGIASSLPPSAGTHQLWLTSSLMILSRTTRLYGSRRWSTAIVPSG